MLRLRTREAWRGSSGGIRSTLSLNFHDGTVVDNRSGVNPTFTRATTKTHTDWEGRPSTALSGEVVFEGLRRVYNQFPSQVVSANNANTTVTAGQTDPNGGTLAYKCVHSTAAAGDFAQLASNSVAIGAGGGGVYSVWLKGEVGGEQVSMTNGGGGTQAVVLTTGWRRYTFAHSLAGQWKGDTYATAGTPTYYRAFSQVEDTLGQTNRAPAEFVDGATQHGAKVNGVKYFNRLNGNSVASNVVTEATGASIPKRTGYGIARLPGVSGVYFSTPGTNVAGDLFAWIDIAEDDWTPAAETPLLGKWTDAGNQRAWVLVLTATTGLPRLYYSRDGTEVLDQIASVAPSYTDGTVGRVGVHRATTGDITFYTAPTGSTNWTQLGTVKSGSAGALFATSAAVTVGQHNAGTGSNPNKASIFRAGYGTSSTNHSSLGDFNPNNWISGGSFVGGVGETWTLNASARINKWANGYYPETASTNLVLQSENFGTTWTAQGTPTRSAAAKMCGNIKLDLIGDDDAGVLEAYVQTPTFTGDGVKAVSIFFSQGTATSTVVRVHDSTAVAERLIAAITWTNGIPAVTMTTGTLIGVFPKANGCWRAEVLTTAVTAANSNQIYAYPATTAAFAVANTGNIYMGGVMAENATARCSSYIPTTTATVTRNKDDLEITTLGGWFNAAAGTMVASVIPGPVTSLEYAAAFNDATSNNLIAMGRSTTAIVFVASGGVTQALINAGAYPAFTAANVAGAWATNDFVSVINGAVAGSDVSGSIPTVTRLAIGQREAGSIQYNGLVTTLDYYNQRLPNVTLQRLTT